MKVWDSADSGKWLLVNVLSQNFYQLFYKRGWVNISNFLITLQDILLVSFGAILGANIRFIIYKKLEKIKFNKNYIILLINTFSSFFSWFISFYFI